MGKKCVSCGAPLEFNLETEQVKCNYCGTINTNRVINLGKIFTDFFSQSIKNKEVKRKRNPMLMVVILIFALGIPAVIVFSQLTTIFGNQTWSSDCQFIDYNHDSVLDIAGFSRISTAWEILSIVDGESGKLLEKKNIQEPGKRNTIYCIDNKYIITVKSDNQLTLYELEGLSIKFEYNLPGMLKGFELKRDVLCLKVDDLNEKFTIGIDINTGKEVNCEDNKELVLPKLSNYDNFYIDPLTGVKYAANYSYKTQTVVSATKNKHNLWSKKIEELKLDNLKPIVSAGAFLVVFGEKANDKQHTFIIGLEKKSGKIIYKVKRKKNTSILLNAYYNNKYIITYWNNALEAYEPATGNFVWDF